MRERKEGASVPLLAEVAVATSPAEGKAAEGKASSAPVAACAASSLFAADPPLPWADDKSHATPHYPPLAPLQRWLAVSCCMV